MARLRATRHRLDCAGSGKDATSRAAHAIATPLAIRGITSEAEVRAELELARRPPLPVLVDPVAEEELRHQVEARNGRPGEVERAAVRLVERFAALRVEVSTSTVP